MVTEDETRIDFLALLVNVGMLIGLALKIRHIRSVSRVFKARRDYFRYFSLMKGLLQLMFWQRAAPIKAETVLPDLSRV